MMGDPNYVAFLGSVDHEKVVKGCLTTNYDEMKRKACLKKDWRVFKESTMLSARSFSFACHQSEYAGDCKNANDDC